LKPLLVLLKITLVGLCWSVLFIEGIRVILITNWHFDIFRTTHWQHAWNLWLSGWVIDETKEWAFILIILSSIPIWISVWAGLSTVSWSKVLGFLGFSPLKIFGRVFEKQVKKITNTASVKVVKKKKSYKEIRPKSIRQPLDDSLRTTSSFDEDRAATLSGIPQKPKPRPSSPIPQPSQTSSVSAASKPVEFTHTLFEMDDKEPVDFDLFAEPENKEQETPKPQKSEKKSVSAPSKKTDQTPNKSKTSGANSTFELLKQKGYDIITGATIKNTFIDFIGVSKNQICMCLNDKEPGDWLADEERFNDEEPLWFSESSHRISPVRKIDLARTILEEKLKSSDLSFEVVAFVIEQIGNIINAEDMLEIWREMNINVTRIDRGTPKEIPLFAKTLEDAEGNVDKPLFEKIKKLLRNIA